MKKKIEALSLQRIVIEDVRFENEAKMIRDMGGAIIHMIAPLGVSSSPSPDVHSSENGITQHTNDFILDNSDKSPLKPKIEQLMRHLS